MPGAALDRAREAFSRRAWTEAFELYRQSDEGEDLTADDLEAYGESAWWAGQVPVTVAVWPRAYAQFLDGGERERAGLVALGLALQHLYRAEASLSTGWLGRAQRLLAAEPGSVAHGYLLDTEADLALYAGDTETATERTQRVSEIAARHGDGQLELLARFMHGRILVARASAREGLAVVDEVMLSVVEGRLSPTQSGRLYCHMISICRELADYGRALEWTDATIRWCESLAGAGNFTPICRIHRAHLENLRGHWHDAEVEARRACDELVGRYAGGVGDGWYAVGECRRRRGDLTGAEEAYDLAEESGYEPLPGRAALRLARGQANEASAIIGRALAEQPANRLRRARLLGVGVEAALASGDPGVAGARAGELTAIAAEVGTPALRAEAALSSARVQLADGDAAAALDSARSAWRLWSELSMPYEAAIARLVVAEACRAAGDDDSARRELHMARQSFAALGAKLALARTDAVLGAAPAPGGLTAREVDVLRLVAAGNTNRGIAAQLGLSEKTVGRHLENIFTKLGTGSRAAATAFAVEHGLVRPPG
jgi:DNA-binding NarL/FixJ family response regulator